MQDMDDLYKYDEEKPHNIKRLVWMVVNKTVFRCIIGKGRVCSIIKNSILNAFGAKVKMKTRIYHTCDIWAPWNLEMDEYSVLADKVKVYNKALVKIEKNVVVSQGSYLCTASHDITDIMMPLVTAPIKLKERCWVASNAFIGMGVTIGEGAVVGACAAVFKNVEPWTVVGGNPAKFIKKRIIKQ